MSTTDYNAQFQDFVDERRPTGDYVLAVFAADLVTELRETNPDLLTNWLDINAAQFVTQVLGDQERSRRGRLLSDAPRSVFKIAANRFRAGDESAFAQYFVVSDDKLRRRLGDMTRADHLFVAEWHIKRSNAALFEAAFHRAIAKRIPVGMTTKDAMSEAEYIRLRATLAA